MKNKTVKMLQEKWEPILTEKSMAPITDNYRARTTAQLLENQEEYLKEATTSNAGNIQNWDPVLINLVRRMAPKLIAHDICGVQAMNGPIGLIFAIRSRYTNAAGAEAFVNEANTNHSGAAAPLHVGDDPWDATFTTGVGKTTAAGESEAWNGMSMTIEKVSATATTRQLRADYSTDLAQDLRAIHGLDAENELSNILSTEIISEINREIVRTIYAVAKPGAQWKAAGQGEFDLAADTDGRWFLEKIKGLLFAIERDANAVGKETRRGKGNILITSADVASALALAGVLNYAPALQTQIDLDVDETGVTFAGKAGRFKVFIDPYLGTDGYVVGFKGPNPYDAGVFYAPYVPLQLFRATDVSNFSPAIGFKTRYAIVSNPFTSLNTASNVYYRKARILNLMA